MAKRKYQAVTNYVLFALHAMNCGVIFPADGLVPHSKDTHVILFEKVSIVHLCERGYKWLLPCGKLVTHSGFNPALPKDTVCMRD